MIKLEKVFTVGGRLTNLGEWDYQLYQVAEINNPFPGPMEAPDDWDLQITYRTECENPMPEDAIEEELEVFFDRSGTLHLVRDAEGLEMESRVIAANEELVELMKDVLLGLATPEDIERAKELRIFLKNSQWPK